MSFVLSVNFTSNVFFFFQCAAFVLYQSVVHFIANDINKEGSF